MSETHPPSSVLRLPSRHAFAYALLIPAFVLIVAVALYPAAQTMWISLQKVSMIMPGAEFVGLGNYERLLRDARFWNAWKTSRTYATWKRRGNSTRANRVFHTNKC